MDFLEERKDSGMGFPSGSMDNLLEDRCDISFGNGADCRSSDFSLGKSDELLSCDLGDSSQDDPDDLSLQSSGHPLLLLLLFGFLLAGVFIFFVGTVTLVFEQDLSRRFREPVPSIFELGRLSSGLDILTSLNLWDLSFFT